MDPVAIFQHSPTESPGHFATFLDEHSIPWRLIRIDQDERVPSSPEGFSGLCFMGGTMSVNDDLPWIEDALALIRAAVERDIPVIGHCLGGQLMSRALGGTVSRHSTTVIGWWKVLATPSPAAREWLGDVTDFEAFHWHGDTFSIPPGAEHILLSEHCGNQAFVMGPHLGMQCHVEMTEAMINSWNDHWHVDVRDPASPPASAQRPSEILAGVEENLPRMRAVAHHLYRRWIQGLRSEIRH